MTNVLNIATIALTGVIAFSAIPAEARGFGSVVVRDHRAPTGVVIRDHRVPTGPFIRDHRVPTGPIVRDHRTPTGGVIVRDHRRPGGVIVIGQPRPPVWRPPVVRPPVARPPIMCIRAPCGPFPQPRPPVVGQPRPPIMCIRAPCGPFPQPPRPNHPHHHPQRAHLIVSGGGSLLGTGCPVEERRIYNPQTARFEWVCPVQN